MARGKHKKSGKGHKNNQKNFKVKKKKDKSITARDIKHTDQYAKYKLRIENEKKKKVIEVEEPETEEVVQDPYALLLSSFKNKKDLSSNLAIDSDDSSSEEMEVENEIDLKNDSDKIDAVEISDSLIPRNGVEEKEEEEHDEEKENSSEDEIDVTNMETNDTEVNNKLDPFHIHLNYDIPESLLNSVSSNPMTIKSTRLYWPVLHNLKVDIPIVQNENEPPKISHVTIEDEVEYAKEYDPPALIQSVDWNKLYVKSQIQKNILKANKKYLNLENEEFTELQKELFSIINNYQDLYYSERTFENGEQIRFTYCLHAVNHILKTRLKILHHNDKLYKKSIDQVPDEFRDQGLVRPKILIIVPFRDSCLKIVNMMCSILLENKGNIINKSRFLEEFSGSELMMPKKNPKPEDYVQLFTGNIDDNFRIGLSFTKKSVKLYSDFYSSDIIIGSPLGLRMVIGAEGDKERDYDFLASIELLILDQSEVFLMQNWDHLLLIFEHLHVQPKESHGTDFSRVRSWALNGWTKFYRQTLIFSSIQSSELNAIFSRRCFNYAGKIRVINPVEDGSICCIVVPLSHVFQKFKTESATDSLDARFKLFTEKILPQYKDPVMTGVLIYVPSYFDYVRIRNHLKKDDYNFVQICEYSKDSKVARARDMFFHNEARLLLYSERFHFFRRITLKGIRHIIFYQPPTFPHFYSEMCNLMQEGNQNRFLGNDSGMTITVLYCKYDIHQLSAIVKTSRASKMMTSEKNVHMFSTVEEVQKNIEFLDYVMGYNGIQTNLAKSHLVQDYGLYVHDILKVDLSSEGFLQVSNSSCTPIIRTYNKKKNFNMTPKE